MGGWLHRVYRRVLRRETHAARTLPAVIVAVVALLLALALLVGGVWWWLDAGFREFAAASQPGVLIGAGVVAVLIAVSLLVLALSSGRCARRSRTTQRVALLVDDDVLADAITDAVASGERADRRRVPVTLGRKKVIVRVTPTGGLPVDTARAGRAAKQTMACLGCAVSSRVILASRWVVA